ncbi:tyrosine-protein phosphatase [Arthrobacter sp. AZCC_0090]|uniref:tyrosine-protein phosphatase n=1 Tax=Arthrobacter sp. AZCC_0090 TaxID=2735881 RepID=UPI001619D836|nr:tyrosine-protein phosphatase [Arthrobacter sp. AZCC_0090]MBB6406307.1 hypothetical protein [Arthrobacter sp. AZCC_0090]
MKTVGNTVPVPMALTNLRDLGGLPVAGGITAHGVVWRSDDVSCVPDDEATMLHRNGLRTVIDLRSPREASFTGRGPLGALAAVSYHHIPFTADVAAPRPGDGSAMSLTRGAQAFGRWYAALVEERAAEVTLVLNIISAARGATLFHCAAGKDRTGVMAAVLLSAIGAADETIVADYVRTTDNLEALHERLTVVLGPLLAALPNKRPPLDGRGSAMMGAHAETMRTMLTTLRQRHGSILEPMHAAGLDQSTIQRLRSRLLIEQPRGPESVTG